MTLIDNKIDEAAKGATVDSLKKSREYRHKFIQKYGVVPSSILVYDRGDKSIDINLSKRSKEHVLSRKTKLKDSNPEISSELVEVFWTRGSGSSEGIRGTPLSPLSRFPQNIGRLVVKFYCPEGGLIYDPFAGHNSRMQLTYESKRNYIGVDISKEFMENNRKIRDILLKKNEQGLFKNESTIELIEGSSAKVDLPSNRADFTITSPPYWDIEYYGDEPEQLGMNKTYNGFLHAIYRHIKENFRILKPGAFCAWFVNDFRKGGIFYAYHSDLMPYFEKAGFITFSIYIVDLGNTFGEIFVRSIEKTKIFPKRHEYCLLFQKPSE